MGEKLVSAGLLVVRRREGQAQFLLAHPGGPFWARRNEHAWSIPKGLANPGEPLIEAARREFLEETGLDPPEVCAPLTPLKQPGGKRVHAWLAEADLDLSGFRSGEFVVMWPPRSGRLQTFPEIDRIDYFYEDEALSKVLRGQAPFLAEALTLLG